MAASLRVAPMSFLLLFIFMTAGSRSGTENADETGGRMEPEELLGLFEVMESLLDDPGWALAHPQPCTETPWPGVECGVDLDGEDAQDQESPLFHVTKIHVGPDVLAPPCKPSATLSPSVVKLPFLRRLSIFNCFQTHQVSLPSAIFGSFSSLEHVSIVSNPALVGQIPSSLGQVSGLKVLSLAQNSLQGVIPEQIGKLGNLEQMDFSYNNLSGSIPEDIGGLKSLTILDLCWNRLEGTIPSSAGQLQQLQKMDLSSNKLSSTIPPSMGLLSNLVLLDLSHNVLSGPIPETFSGLHSLQYLLMSNNPINFGPPSCLKSLKKLNTLSFSSCGLTGPIPSYFPLLENLTALSLDNNSLNGPVPQNLASVPHLNQLNLSFNQFSGELMLADEFINRLGKRLDVKGNTGLCTRQQQLLNNTTNSNNSISTNLETAPCLNPTATSSTDNETRISQSPQSHDQSQSISPASSLIHSDSSRGTVVMVQPLTCVVVLLLVTQHA